MDEVKEKMVGYIVTALGLVVGLAWNEAISSFINVIFPLSKNTVIAKFIYAFLLTVLLIVFTSKVLKLINKISNKKSMENGTGGQETVGAASGGGNKPDWTKFILPGAIVIAALMISGSLLLTRQGSVEQNDTTGAIGDNVGPVEVSADGAPYLGNKNAKVTIVEFADFRCPFCERFFKDAEAQLIRDYVNTGKAKFAFKHYAFLGSESTWASEAAECANEQGKFWPYHNWLYNNQAPESDLAYYSKANLIKYAGKVGGLDIAKFSSCLNTDKYATKVSADMKDGQNAGVNGTPTIFVNGRVLVGAQPYATVKALIESELAK